MLGNPARTEMIETKNCKHVLCLRERLSAGHLPAIAQAGGTGRAEDLPVSEPTVLCREIQAEKETVWQPHPAL